ncbi:MAG TPA: lipoprotein [Geobacteraceae bacterium]
MKKHILIITAALAVSGCAGLTRPGGAFYPSAQENKLDRAVTLLQQGKTSAAEGLLSAICAGPKVAGVTDEALFRLSLLQLGSGKERNGGAQALHNLERLKREYPASSWTPLAAGLTDLLASADDVRQQNRKLKELNLSLTKENKELHQSIDKLKNLEMELGRGTKH